MKKKVSKKNITIEDLAMMVQKGFSQHSKELNDFKHEIGVFKHEMIGFKQDMTLFKNQTEKSLFNLHSDITEVKKRLSSIEHTLGPILTMTEVLKINWRDHESRLAKIERKVGLTR